MLFDSSKHFGLARERAGRTTYRAHVIGSDERLERMLEFEASGLDDAVDVVVHHVKRGSVALQSQGKHIGTIHLMGAGQWWFTSICPVTLSS